MLNSIVRISISFLVRCISPLSPPLDPNEDGSSISSMVICESDGEARVAATRAAMAEGSGSGFLPFPLSWPPEDSPWDEDPSSLPLPEKRSFRNWGVSNLGICTPATEPCTDLRPSEAVSKMSVAVSLTLFIHPSDCFLNSKHRDHRLRMFHKQSIQTAEKKLWRNHERKTYLRTCSSHKLNLPHRS